MIENLVIPRLIAESGALSPAPAQWEGRVPMSEKLSSITDEDVAALTELSVNDGAPSLFEFVLRFLDAGHSVETIFVSLLAPAARKVGECWENDSEDFVTVTMALWRIQEVLRELAVRVPSRIAARPPVRAALFSTMPGEQHSLGTMMVAECFQRGGWMTDVLIEPERAELVGKFASCHYDLIGLTLSVDCSSAALTDLITSIRTVSRNPYVKVLIGGRTVNLQPELVAECGADGTAIDATSAVALADWLVPLMTERLVATA